MPIVSYRATEYTLSNAASDIGEVYNVLAAELPNKGFTNVTNHQHVHADKGNVSLSVFYLSISGRQFWQVIAAAEDSDQANADAQIEYLQTLIAGLRFF